MHILKTQLVSMYHQLYFLPPLFCFHARLLALSHMGSSSVLVWNGSDSRCNSFVVNQFPFSHQMEKIPFVIHTRRNESNALGKNVYFLLAKYIPMQTPEHQSCCIIVKCIKSAMKTVSWVKCPLWQQHKFAKQIEQRKKSSNRDFQTYHGHLHTHWWHHVMW